MPVATTMFRPGTCRAMRSMRREFPQPGDGLGDAGVLAPPLLRIVLPDFLGDDEHVLVHENPAECAGLDGAEDRLNLRQARPSVLDRCLGLYCVAQAGRVTTECQTPGL
jgi:hypothetical protein